MYDIAIIGSGPAGISAAINLKILNRNFVWFGTTKASTKMQKAERIRNYPGLMDVTGEQLSWAMMNHADYLNVQPEEEIVTGIYDLGDHFALLCKDKQYEAKTILLCLGVEAAHRIAGEEEFLGRGVSYCATCDGFLYKDKTIGIYCTDKRFEHEIEYLCKIVKKAYVMPYYTPVEIEAENVECLHAKPIRLEGGMKVNKIIFRDGEKEVDGVFLLKGAISPKALISGLQLDEQGHIEVDRQCRTNIAGVFAAGDCTGRPYQIAKAIGEGNIAAHTIVEYLEKRKKKELENL